MVKKLPARPETLVQSLGQEDPLEKEMAAHSSILAWRIPWTEEPRASPWGCKESDMTEQVTLFSVTSASGFLCHLCYIIWLFLHTC